MYRVRGDVLVKRSGAETVFIHLETNRVHHTNATGSRIWELLTDGLSNDQIAGRLAEEYSQDIDLMQAEVSRFIDGLRKEAILEPSEDQQ